MLNLILQFCFLLILNAGLCQNQQPHIVIIIADDLGWNDLSFHGSDQIPTPNIDALAYNGIILNNFYTQQSCTPSRTALLTGNYPIRSGMQGIPMNAGEDRSIPQNMPVLPELLKKLGYKTHLVGKWHVGSARRSHTPTRRGFDSFFGYWNGFIGYFNYVIAQDVEPYNLTFSGFDLHDNLAPSWKDQGKYATELFTEKSLDVIDSHDTKTPLFLMITHLAAHTGKDGIEMEVTDEKKLNETFGYIKDFNRRKCAGVVAALDQSVGEVVNKLAQKDMLDNSIILFLSDNGAQTVGMYQNYGSNWPLRGLKLTLLQGGVKSASAIYSPLFKKQRYTHQHLMHITDWLPTFYHAAGGNTSSLGNIDGVNAWESLSNDKSLREEILLNIDEHIQYSGIVSNRGRYKLLNGSFNDGVYDGYYGESGRNLSLYNIKSVLNSQTNKAIKRIAKVEITEQSVKNLRNSVSINCKERTDPHEKSSGFEFFDLVEDPCESNNLINDSSYNRIIKKLKNKLIEFYQQLVPQTNKFTNINSNPAKCNNTWFNWLDIDSCYKNNSCTSKLV